MTRRSSLRAQAREIYRPLAAKKAAEEDPPSQSSSAASLTAPNLTEKARALYEETAVPVAEIARLAGVTERTIYKYAARQAWKRRYARAEFAPLKGAGARFIRREDKNKPVAMGLKATDPAGAARAAAGCGEAQRLSDEARRQAEAVRRQAQQAQRTEAIIRAIEWTLRAFKDLRQFWERRDKGPGPLDDQIERVLTQVWTMAISRWEALQKEEGAEFTAPRSVHPAPADASRQT